MQTTPAIDPIASVQNAMSQFQNATVSAFSALKTSTTAGVSPDTLADLQAKYAAYILSKALALVDACQLLKQTSDAVLVARMTPTAKPNKP